MVSQMTPLKNSNTPGPLICDETASFKNTSVSNGARFRKQS
jgi:hypothetical protein